MRYIYVCPSCQKAFSDESDYPLSEKPCPNCAGRLVYANCIKEDWDLKTDAEKAALKKSFSYQPAAAADRPVETNTVRYTETNDSLNAKRLENIDLNLQSIKSMMIFFTIVAVICIVIALYAAIKTNQAIEDFRSFFY